MLSWSVGQCTCGTLLGDIKPFIQKRESIEKSLRVALPTPPSPLPPRRRLYLSPGGLGMRLNHSVALSCTLVGDGDARAHLLHREVVGTLLRQLRTV